MFWKNTFAAGSRRLLPWLLFSALLVVALAMMPSLYRNETALQIRTSQQGVSLPDGFYVYQHLNAQGIQIKSITPAQDSLVIKFDTKEQSRAAQKALHKIFPYGVDIAQMDSSSTVTWLSRISFNHQSIG